MAEDSVLLRYEAASVNNRIKMFRGDVVSSSSKCSRRFRPLKMRTLMIWQPVDVASYLSRIDARPIFLLHFYSLGYCSMLYSTSKH
jgi:hypothetical protein